MLSLYLNIQHGIYQFIANVVRPYSAIEKISIDVVFKNVRSNATRTYLFINDSWTYLALLNVRVYSFWI